MSSFDPSTPSQTLTPTPGGNSGSKLGIIIGSCVGGFFAVLIGVCLLVPFLRRRAARQASRDFEDAADVDTPRSHTRNLSEAGAPLLSVKTHHDSSGHSSFPHSIHSVHHESLPVNGHGHDPVVDLDLAQAQAGSTPPSSSTSHEDAGGSTLYNPWRTRTAAPPPPAASDPSPPRATHSSLRRARTRIRATMAPVPEDNVPPPSPSSPPPPSPPPADHPSWLRIPSPAPLIGAFRRSVAASTSSRNTSASSLAGSANAAHAFPTPARSNETFRSFSSAASEGHTRSPDPHPSSQPQPQSHTRDIPARLRPSEPARVAQLVPGPFHMGTGPGSRAASLLSGSGGARSATGTGSELSVYTDARSNLDASELGERR